MISLPSSHLISRRNLVVGLGALPLLTAMTASFARATEGACIITPKATEGPYYFDPALVRSDITEGGKGMPMELALQILNAQCQPLGNARVDLWHADARGYYSGYSGQNDDGSVSTEGQTFMRGTQFTDAQGLAHFSTVYPGWYRGRTTHIHFKVFITDQEALTGQLYFPDAVSDLIYAEAAPYAERKLNRDTTNADDWLLRSAGEAGSLAAIREEGGKYAAAMTIGIAQS